MSSFVFVLLTLGGFRESLYAVVGIIVISILIVIWIDKKYSVDGTSRKVLCEQKDGLLPMLLIFMQIIPLIEYFDICDYPREVLFRKNISYLWQYSYVPLLLTAGIYLIAFLLCRKRGVATNIPARLLWRIYIFTVILFLILNPWASQSWAQLPLSIALMASFVCLSICVLRRLSCLLWLVMAIVFFILSVAAHQSIELNNAVLMQVFSSSWQDAKAYLTWSNISLLIGAGIASFIVWHVMYRMLRDVPRSSLWVCGWQYLLIATCVMFFTKKVDNGYSYAWPFGASYNLAYNSASAMLIIQRCKKLLNAMPSELPLDAKCKTIDSDSSIICIVHIGESVSANHLSINGYERCTTPWLSSQSSLINYKTCISSAMYTDRAVLTMLTNGRRDFLSNPDSQYLPTSPSLLDFFHVCGFKCGAFWGESSLDTHPGSLFPRQIEYFSRSADKVYGYPGLDFHKQLFDIIDFSDKFHKENLFLLINNFGSHTPYSAFDHSSSPFPVEESYLYVCSPSSDNARDYTNLINKYDNTIYHTDDYIKKLAHHFKGKPFVYIYMSDHGEPLGEGGFWSRSFSASQYHHFQSCKVPFFIYASPEFVNSHPHFIKALTQLRLNQSCITAHEHLFHTVLGLMGISSRYYEPTLDLSSPAVIPYSGEHPK